MRAVSRWCFVQRRTLSLMVDHLSVTTTTPDRNSAAQLAASAVRAKLAATAQVHGPVANFFWHLGEEGQGEEWLAVFKTTSERYPELEAHLIAEHPWENPEVTAVTLAAGSAGYLAWIERATTPNAS
ncbi:divalent cation tolerance protein [Prauserella shujinwangii]|uniref:Divalent cation tolerance protein n=2 Tax=Prauserella shujinwangii TaxID=1453103 RepID=A0A2T0M2U7_9PSEU|nr:divalent cation tolerance protein [Prauserella shujinwangii]